MATAKEFCNPRVIVAKAGEGLSDVAKRMLDEGVGCVVVVEENERGQLAPTGMLTDRDMVVGVLARTDRHIHAVTVGDVMTADVVTAWESEAIEDVFKRMRSFGVRRIPIVNDEGGLEGLVSFDDWVDYLREQLFDLATLLEREGQRESERQEQSETRRGRKRPALSSQPGGQVVAPLHQR